MTARGTGAGPRRLGGLLLPVLAAVAALALLRPAAADRVVLKRGPALRGVVSRTDTEVVVSRYGARHPGMTYGVTRVPIADVRRVDEDPPRPETVRRRREDLAPGDVAGRVGLARYAIGQRFQREARRCLEEALALAPNDPDARALYATLSDVERFLAERRRRPELHPPLKVALQAAAALGDATAQAEALARLQAEFGYTASPDDLLRIASAAREPRGFAEELSRRPAADGAARAPVAMYVPAAADAVTPIPLVLALHDAGRGGRGGTAVVGTGRDGATLYLSAARDHGWLLVCPTSPTPAWSGPTVVPFLVDLLGEIFDRFPVDLDRVVVTGHGTGGTAAFALAAARPDLFAAVAASGAPALPAPPPALRAASAFFLFHGEDDPSAPPAVSRAAADALLAAGADVVYLELTGVGHAFPSDALAEWAFVVRGKRLLDAKRADDWPRSSFLRAASGR